MFVRSSTVLLGELEDRMGREKARFDSLDDQSTRNSSERVGGLVLEDVRAKKRAPEALAERRMQSRE